MPDPNGPAGLGGGLSPGSGGGPVDYLPVAATNWTPILGILAANVLASNYNAGGGGSSYGATSSMFPHLFNDQDKVKFTSSDPEVRRKAIENSYEFQEARKSYMEKFKKDDHEWSILVLYAGGNSIIYWVVRGHRSSIPAEYYLRDGGDFNYLLAVYHNHPSSKPPSMNDLYHIWHFGPGTDPIYRHFNGNGAYSVINSNKNYYMGENNYNQFNERMQLWFKDHKLKEKPHKEYMPFFNNHGIIFK